MLVLKFECHLTDESLMNDNSYKMQKVLFCKKILKIYASGRRTGRWSLMLKM